MKHPIPIGSRGLRYLDLTKAHHRDLRAFVTDRLHALSYDKAMAFYTEVYPSLTDDERAYLGCNDRWFLQVFLLHRRDMLNPDGNPSWLYARTREVEAEP